MSDSLFAHLSKTSSHRSHYYETFVYPTGTADGSIKRYQLQKGFGLTIRDVKILQPITIKIYQESPLFELALCLDGGLSYQSNQYHYQTKNKQSNMSFLQDSTIYMDQLPGDYMQGVAIYLTDSALETYLSRILQDYDSSLSSYFIEGQSSFIQNSIDSSIQLILQQILRCPYSGTTQRFYLESKCLELLTVYLAQYGNEKKRLNEFTWNSYEIELINEAKLWILDHLDQPITINQISKQIGINDFKLKKGFRELLGTTVFRYIQEQRLVRSQQLLADKNMNITEVALAVGYQNPSRFTSVFKDTYGITPSQYRKTK